MQTDVQNKTFLLGEKIDGSRLVKFIVALFLGFVGSQIALANWSFDTYQHREVGALILITSVFICFIATNLILEAVFNLSLATIARKILYKQRATSSEMENALQQAKKRGFDSIDWYGFLNAEQDPKSFKCGVTKKALVEALYRMNLAADMNEIHEGELDGNGYPTMFTLTRISHWPEGTYLKLMEFITSIWADESDIFRAMGDGEYIYQISTKHLSGNLDVIAALRENELFWSRCWIYSHRNGVHQFLIPALVPKTELSFQPKDSK